MNATEFLKEKGRLWRRRNDLVEVGPVPCTAIATLVCGFALLEIHWHWRILPSPLVFITCFGMTAICVWVASTWLFRRIGDRKYDRFIEDHQEMKNLPQWIAAQLPASRYPTSEKEMLALHSETLSELEGRARRANAGFDLREAAGTAMRQCCKTGDESESGVAGELLYWIFGYVNDLNNDYLAYWDLTVKTVKILPEYAAIGPRKFREDLWRFHKELS